MTLTEAQAMTPEQKRVKLAELMGWTGIHADGYKGNFLGRPKWSTDEETVMLPDYCNDLNAVHEVEKALTEDQCEAHDENLRQVCAPYGLDAKYPAEGYWFHATADQRTTALILTLSQA